VQSRKYGIEGLIRLGDLGADVWKYNQKAQCIDGVRSGTSIHLGKVIKVHIVSVNVPSRQLNVTPAEPFVSIGSRRKKTKPTRRYEKDRMRKRTRGKR
jgi:hypothetical protein